MNLKKSLLLIFLILAIDQISKIYIKTHFFLGESIEVFNWFKILFIENEGAAWGAKLSDVLPISDNTGKLILTIFRLFAIVGIGYWLVRSHQKKGEYHLSFGGIIDFCRGSGKHYRFSILWYAVRPQQQPSRHCFCQRALWQPILRKSGRHALFPDDRYELARLGTVFWGQSLPFFRTGL